MSFLKHIQLSIPALVGLPVTVWDGTEEAAEQFEKKFCFSPDLQPLFTAAGVGAFFVSKEENRIYEITDALDVHSIIIKTTGQMIVLGPYVITQWNDITAKILLAKCGIPADHFSSYKMYRCGIPFIEKVHADGAASFVLDNMVNSANLTTIRIEPSNREKEDESIHISEEYGEIEEVNQRYEIENQIMEGVRQGNASQVFQAFRSAASHNINVRFTTNTLTDSIAGALGFRVLIRHAAVQAGLSPVFVDTLSQEYAQKMHRAINEKQIIDLMRNYIIIFCNAVRENQKTNYSPYVKRAVQYIDLRFSQPITIKYLCQMNHVSQPYFARLFKQETKKTVTQYIKEVRCKRAAELLENSNLSIQKISQYVGYEDSNYFIRVFRLIMGMAPQEYRRDKLFH